MREHSWFIVSIEHEEGMKFTPGDIAEAINRDLGTDLVAEVLAPIVTTAYSVRIEQLVEGRLPDTNGIEYGRHT